MFARVFLGVVLGMPLIAIGVGPNAAYGQSTSRYGNVGSGGASWGALGFGGTGSVVWGYGQVSGGWGWGPRRVLADWFKPYGRESVSRH
jgi:hypothetical protein